LNVDHVLEIKHEEDEDCCLVQHDTVSFSKIEKETRL